MAYNNVSMLVNHMLAQQKSRAKQFGEGILSRMAEEEAQCAEDGNLQMTETRLFYRVK